jgi:hypothetical protein
LPKWPIRGRRDFKGQVRGVSHQGQEKALHLKAGYIDADFPSFETFPLHSHGGPYIRQLQTSGRQIWFPNDRFGIEVGHNPRFSGFTLLQLNAVHSFGVVRSQKFQMISRPLATTPEPNFSISVATDSLKALTCFVAAKMTARVSAEGIRSEVSENAVLNELAGSSPLRSAESGGGNYFALS